MPFEYNWWIIVPVVVIGLALAAVGLFLWFASGLKKVGDARRELSKTIDEITKKKHNTLE